MYFVGVEKWGMLGKQFGIVPGELSVFRRFAIAVAPVASAPVRGDVRNAGVADGYGKDVGPRLQVLRHETSITCSHAADLRGIDKSHFFAESLDALDDVVAAFIAPRAYMAGGKFLPEARSP